MSKYDALAAERRWRDYWERESLFAYDPDGPGEVFSIDTPPPTVSGSLHIGHVFSYTQAEIIARYRRMRGYKIFYPFGFDDNGLPTERLVEKERGIRGRDLPREEFIRQCKETVAKYHQQFQELWQSLGFSVDWKLSYSTISPVAQRISQRSFLDLYHKGLAYRQQSPVLWCPECATSIAQADLEDREMETSFSTLAFRVGEQLLEIATTRPELLPACVAVLVHPDDQRYTNLVGKEAEVPLFGHLVPIMSDDQVERDLGTGAVMVCTFGDQQDVTWWQQYQLPLRQIIGADGRIESAVPLLGGLKVKQARERVLELLAEHGLLIRQQPLQHHVAVHERCGKPVEYNTSVQWFVSVLDQKEELLAAGENIRWYPAYMGQRYRDWVSNLRWDWCISRQRYFGVPFPVWYCADCGAVVLASDADLPVNPLNSLPGTACSCGCRSFIPEKDVMDTWATSSVSPQINARWGEADERPGLLPMSMRTQAHEIIRTWAFYSIVKSLYHHGAVPWRDIMICGFVLAKQNEKISKSKDNAGSTPLALIAEYSADVVRYWAASARLGSDIAFTSRELQAGRRLVTKLWNASRFAMSRLEGQEWFNGKASEPLDLWLLARLALVQKEMIRSLDHYEVGLARESLEKFFWHDFCDNWLETVKDRLYNPDQRGLQAWQSGCFTLWTIMVELLKLFAIFLPFVTEEIFMNGFNNEGAKSLHLQQWQDLSRYTSNFPGQELWQIISDVRGYKSSRSLALVTPIRLLQIHGPAELLQALAEADGDIRAVTRAENLEFHPAASLAIQIEC